MGTRGLWGFIIASRRYAVYNNNDSYPDGLGMSIIAELLKLDPKDYTLVAQSLRDIKWVSAESPNPEESWDFLKIRDGKVKCLEDSIYFLRDSIFCEWAYLVDFENERMEVWSFGDLVSELTFDEIVAEGVDIMDAFTD